MQKNTYFYSVLGFKKGCSRGVVVLFGVFPALAVCGR